MGSNFKELCNSNFLFMVTFYSLSSTEYAGPMQSALHPSGFLEPLQPPPEAEPLLDLIFTREENEPWWRRDLPDFTGSIA
jgi:hypothetical protein